jgi:hypothetical protein
MEAAGKHLFNQPTDLGIGPNGEIFVSTGHGGDDPRIVRFDKNGKFITTWSLKESTDGPTTRHDIHTMVVDNKGIVYAADRELKKIRVYDSNGKHLRDIQLDYLVSGLYINKDGSLWMVSGQDGQVMKLDWNGKVLGATGKIGKGNNEYGEAHMMTMGLKNEIYVADTVNNRVQKLVRSRTAMMDVTGVGDHVDRRTFSPALRRLRPGAFRRVIDADPDHRHAHSSVRSDSSAGERAFASGCAAAESTGPAGAISLGCRESARHRRRDRSGSEPVD